MMDEKDFESAAMLEQFERDSAINKAQRNAQKKTPPPDFDGTCPECGSDVQPERVEIGYYLCVHCVHEWEHRQRLMARP